MTLMHARKHSPVERGPSTVKLRDPKITISYFQNMQIFAKHVINVQEQSLALIALNAEKLVGMKANPKLFEGIKNPIFYPDGSPICWFNKMQSPRIPGV